MVPPPDAAFKLAVPAFELDDVATKFVIPFAVRVPLRPHHHRFMYPLGAVHSSKNEVCR